MMTLDEDGRRFPILKSRVRDEQEFLPWAFVEECAWKQAEINHCGQSLAYLAQRGGMSWRELYAALYGLRVSESRPDVDHRAEVLKLQASWEASRS